MLICKAIQSMNKFTLDRYIKLQIIIVIFIELKEDDRKCIKSVNFKFECRITDKFRLAMFFRKFSINKKGIIDFKNHLKLKSIILLILNIQRLIVN